MLTPTQIEKALTAIDTNKELDVIQEGLEFLANHITDGMTRQQILDLQPKLWSFYEMQDLMPDLMDIIKKCEDNSALIGKVIDLVSSAAAHSRSDDLFKAHKLISELIPFDLRVPLDLQAYKLACARVNQGYKHPAYAALLIPRVKFAELADLNAREILVRCESLEADTKNGDALDWPACLYDPDIPFDIDDEVQGLFRPPLGPQFVQRMLVGEANRLGGRASKGQIHKLVIAISGKTWPEAKSILKADRLYASILTLLLGLFDDNTWAKETVAWWQENIILPSEPVDHDKKSSPLEGSARDGRLRDPVERRKAQMAAAAQAPAPARAPARAPAPAPPRAPTPEPARVPTPAPASPQARTPSSHPAPDNGSAPALAKAFAAVSLAEPVPQQVSRRRMALNAIRIPSESPPDLPSEDSSSLSSENERSPSPPAPIKIKLPAKRKAAPRRPGPKRKDAPPSDPFETGDEALPTPNADAVPAPNSDATAADGEEPPAKKARTQAKGTRQPIKRKAKKF
ncbi:hypothetical protein JR316_0009887 [Psilocybe cubensis]|uniref:Uncharacterized protein n=1 Tax=Psilocybe cubensis TaxID=181762 RepID=A0ACB8GQ25_PSICU|nr:hypothetical protein JR316_0009887 [Psilocybe cubensis]KAH9477661.1 hypothetical protein JR316_0009887 [Psilocybe cubensis]